MLKAVLMQKTPHHVQASESAIKMVTKYCKDSIPEMDEAFIKGLQQAQSSQVLLSAQNPFNVEVSQFIQAESKDIRKILDLLRLIPNIEVNNPSLSRFFSTGKRSLVKLKGSRVRTVKPRSVTIAVTEDAKKASSSSSSFSREPAPVKVAAAPRPRMFPEQPSNTMAVEDETLLRTVQQCGGLLLQVHSALASPDLASIAKPNVGWPKESTDYKAAVAETCRLLMVLHDMHTVASTALDVGVSLDDVLGVYLAGVESFIQYKDCLVKHFSCWIHIAYKSELSDFLRRKFHNTSLATLSFMEVLLSPLTIVAPLMAAEMQRIRMPCQPLVDIIELLRHPQVELLVLDKLFDVFPARLLPSTRVKCKEAIQMVHIEPEVITFEKALFFFISPDMVIGAKELLSPASSFRFKTLFVAYTNECVVTDIPDNIALSFAITIEVKGTGKKYIIKTNSKEGREQIKKIFA